MDNGKVVKQRIEASVAFNAHTEGHLGVRKMIATWPVYVHATCHDFKDVIPAPLAT